MMKAATPESVSRRLKTLKRSLKRPPPRRQPLLLPLTMLANLADLLDEVSEAKAKRIPPPTPLLVRRDLMVVEPTIVLLILALALALALTLEEERTLLVAETTEASESWIEGLALAVPLVPPRMEVAELTGVTWKMN
jgi:hypothetical protein